jgi:hypothetical protein
MMYHRQKQRFVGSNHINDMQNETSYMESVLFIDSLNAVGSNVDFYVGLNEDTQYDNTGVVANAFSPGKKFTNIKSVELIGMSVPDDFQNSQSTDQQYFIISIPELQGRVISNVPSANGQFAIMYYDRVLLYDFDNKKKEFDTPLSTLSRLSIKLLHRNGELIVDTGPITFTFKIKYKY